MRATQIISTKNLTSTVKLEKLVKLLKWGLKALSLIVLYPLYFISILLHRKKNLWVFGSYNNTFSDNSKYLFYYVTENAPEIEAVWISGNKEVVYQLKHKGYNAFKRWSLTGIWKTLRAKVYIYSAYSSDVNFWTSRRAIKFNLWHGIPLKRIEYNIKVGKLAKKYNSVYTPIYRFLLPANFQKPDYFLSTAPLTTEIFSHAFKIPPKKCLEFGYPRCDIFFWDKKKIETFIYKKEQKLIPILNTLKNSNKTVIYMPTFREKATNDLSKILDFSRINELRLIPDYNG